VNRPRRLSTAIIGLAAVLSLSAPASEARLQNAPTVSGPLRIHPTNPRYFADGSGRAIYLTGSHFWTTIQDWNGKNEPYAGGPAFRAFPEYIAFLKARNHNFTRLWTFDHYQFESTPSPWIRTGLGVAMDGHPKWDVTVVNPAFLNRLRDRVAQFRASGIYVSVMFFRGNIGRDSHASWDAHPFNPANNVNAELAGLTLNAYNDLTHPSALALQKHYIRSVIDTLNDMDNVIWEIANEAQPQSYNWQQHLVDYVRSYESMKPWQHLVGVTSTHPHDNSRLFRTTADWVSPGFDNYDPEDPPATTGRQIVVSDTDHHLLAKATMSWVWKSFLRGEHPILMENELAWDLEPVRKAMGHARALAERIDLAAMTPQAALTETAYCLANPGVEYLVYGHNAGTFWVDLSSGSGRTFTVEWIDPRTGEVVPGSGVLGGNARQFFSSPLRDAGAVLHLKTVRPITARGSSRPF
jgi:uncharacterized protein DUF6298/collagenase-like protein with putative collagen-binding domain